MPETQNTAPAIDVDRLARQARLALAPAEAAALGHALAGQVALADTLPPADGGLPAGAPPHGPLRADVVQPGLTQEQLLQNAPATRDGCILVPRVLD